MRPLEKADVPEALTLCSQNPEYYIVDRIFAIDEKKVAGVRSYVYKCQSTVEGTEKNYELKYILEEARWQLYKMCVM